MEDVTKILLDINKLDGTNESKKSFPIDIKSDSRIVPNTDLMERLNLYELYNTERDNCRKYRLIFTINSVCSNVLFNRYTEMLIDEGCKECNAITKDTTLKVNNTINTSDLTHRLLIDNSEITHADILENVEVNGGKINNFAYHCGLDMFNNHLIRNKWFNHINSVLKSDVNSKATYNTLSDFLRDHNGKIIQEDVGGGSSVVESNIHTYTVDSLYTFNESFAYNCIEKNGWYGFVNSTSFDVSNSLLNGGELDDLVINKVLNGNKACEFIDLYPDRTLFSFVPKYNKYRNRAERNWDCFITYPYYSDVERLDDISDNLASNSVRILNTELTHVNSGSGLLEMLPMFRHTLKPGEFITLYYIRKKDYVNKKADGLIKHPIKMEVFSIGDSDGSSTNNLFSILYKNLEDTIYLGDQTKGFILKNEDDITDNTLIFFYKKNIQNVDCSYYFRRFKKIKNSDGDDLKYDINKLAYGENIYGDRLSQVVFTDDIDTSSILDNLGREVSEVYLTSIKNNAGHKKWYEENDYNDAEYSHCWGKVTSGLNLPLIYNGENDSSPIDDSVKDYNVRCIHNVSQEPNDYNDMTTDIYKFIYKNENGYRLPKVLEDDITKDGVIHNNSNTLDDWYYGDIVEFDSVNYIENVIENVYHRVNTAQREIKNDAYRHIFVDEIQFDDYDKGIFEYEPGRKVDGFTIDTQDKSVLDDAGNYYFANICPEGYMYVPFNKVTLFEYKDEVKNDRPKLINFNSQNAKIENSKSVRGMNYTVLTLYAPVNLGFSNGDPLLVYNKVLNKKHWARLESVVQDSSGRLLLTLLLDENCLLNNKLTDLIVVKPSYGVPINAAFVPELGMFTWREAYLLSELTSNSKLINTPFSNGRLYLENNVNFFMRRQDPYNDSRLNRPISNGKYQDTLRNYSISGNNRIDISDVLYVDKRLTFACD